MTRLTQYKTLQELNKRKINHSKGKDLNYGYLEIQKYLKPSLKKNTKRRCNKKKFKLRTRMAYVKENFRGNYENLECKLCDEQEDETQQHIFECKINCNESEHDYEEIFWKNVEYQLERAKQFSKNIKIRNEMMEIVCSRFYIY